MSVVYYKFKSQKDHDHITFDGTAISVFDLKRDIILAKKLGRGVDFDLAIYNPHSSEEYKDDNVLIQRASSVVVRRLPPAHGMGRGTAARYVAQALGPPQPPPSNMAGNTAGGAAAASNGGDYGGRGQALQHRGMYGQSYPSTPQAAAPAPPPPGPLAPALSAEPDSEAARIEAMFRQSDEHWQHQQESMAESAPQPYGGYHQQGGAGGSRGPRPVPGTAAAAAALQAHNAARYAHLLNRAPPANYVCFRCGGKGHFIQHCPTNGDPSFDKPKIRRTTGIPRAFLRAVEGSEGAPGGDGGGRDPATEGPSAAAIQSREAGVMITPDGGLVVAAPDQRAWERFTARAKTTQMSARVASSLLDDPDALDSIAGVSVPSDLQCGICHRVMRAAVVTRCCQRRYCEECARDSVLSRGMECMGCGKVMEDVEEGLREDVGVRADVERWVRDTLRAKGALKEETKTESTLNTAAEGRRITTVVDGRDRNNSSSGVLAMQAAAAAIPRYQPYARPVVPYHHPNPMGAMGSSAPMMPRGPAATGYGAAPSLPTGPMRGSGGGGALPKGPSGQGSGW